MGIILTCLLCLIMSTKMWVQNIIIHIMQTWSKLHMREENNRLSLLHQILNYSLWLSLLLPWDMGLPKSSYLWRFNYFTCIFYLHHKSHHQRLRRKSFQHNLKGYTHRMVICPYLECRMYAGILLLGNHGDLSSAYNDGLLLDHTPHTADYRVSCI